MAQIKHIYTSPQADVGSTQLVQPSDWNSVHAFTLLEGVSAAVGQITSGTLLFSNLNGVSFGINGQTLTASVAAAGGGLTNIRVSGGTLSNYLSALTLADSNGISWGLNTDSQVTATVKTDYQTSGAYLTTADLSANSSKYGQAWELTGNTAGTTSSAQGTKWYFEGGNSITVSGNSNTIKLSVGNYLTTAMASNRGTDFVQATAGFNGTNCSGTIASNSISVSIGNYLTTADLSANSSKYVQAWELTGNTAGTTSSAQGTKLYFEGGNSITVSGNSNTIKLSVGAYITTADLSANSSKYIQAWELTGNTAGTTSSAQGTKIYFEGGNSITVSGNSNTVKFSVGAYLTTAMASNRASDFVAATAAFSGVNASGTINSTGITVSVAAPGAAAENNWFNLTGNTVGNTSASGSTIMLSAINNVTLSGTNGSVIVISGPTGGGAGISTYGSTAGTTGIASRQMVLVGTNGIWLSQTIGTDGLSNTVSIQPSPASFFLWPQTPVAGTTAVTLGGSSMLVQPFALPWPVSASFLRIPVSVGAFGSSTTGTTAARSYTFNQTNTYVANLYTQNVGASSRSLALLSQFSLSSVLQVIYQIGAASNNQTCTHNITYGATGNNNVNFATNYNVNSATMNVSTTHLTAFTGFRFLDIPAAYLFTPGQYWWGLQQSSATASTSAGGDWPTFTKMTSTGSLVGISQVSANPIEMGGNTSIGSNMWIGFGHGYWTTNASGSSSSSLKMNEISSGANHPIVPFQLVRHN